MDLLFPLFKILGIAAVIFIGGEPAIICLSFVAAAAGASLVTIIIIGYLSAVIGEIFWFILARKISPAQMQKWKFANRCGGAFMKFMNRFDQKKPLRLLFWARSFYGGGLPAIIYLAKTPLSLGRMIGYSMLVNAFWLALFVSLGWVAGKGLQSALELFIDIKIALTVIAVLAIISYSVFYIINKKHKKC